MSSINFAKKLQPAKKAWKSFTTTLQSKLQKLKTRETIKRTKKHCVAAFHTLCSFIHCRLYGLTSRSATRCRHHLYHRRRCHRLPRKSYATIYVDELFPRPGLCRHDGLSMKSSSMAMERITSSSVEKKLQNGNVAKMGVKINIVETKVMMNHEKGNNAVGESSKVGGAADHKLKLPMLPQMKGIDERAEEFISKFREEMKLERQNSILDFQEMLARSA